MRKMLYSYSMLEPLTLPHCLFDAVTKVVHVADVLWSDHPL